MDQNQFYAIKVPFLQKETPKDNEKQQQGLQQGQKQGGGALSIIGVVDASGSMSSWWEMLANFWNQSIPPQNLTTITFDSRPRLSQSPVLSTRIRDHGGGGTEIVPAFELMEKELNKIPIENNITVIFISDGQDNNVRTIEKRMQEQLKGNTQQRLLNFICLGVQSGFPTNIAMNLRQLYHKGDPQIPAIYLIEYVSEQAFFNKFETMRKYFYPAKLIRVDELINLFPFEEDVTDEVYEGQWIISKKKKINILVEEQDPVPIEGFAENELEVDDVVDLFRTWVQHLQVQFMAQKPDTKDKAADALLVMERISQKLADKYKMNVFHFKQEEINDPNQPFDVRAKRNYVYKYGSKLLFFVEEARQLAKGVNPTKMNDFEAAKKLNIGTITGKHQQKALALKGITVEEFRYMRDEFQQIVVNCKFRPINEQGQERSIVSLENQRDILSDSKLVTEALKYVKSQYDFAETFPLVGHGIKVKRVDGCYVNPWLIQVEQFAQQNKIIDSAYLIKNNFKVELNTGGDKKEEINCILPLFHETDDDLQPILRSRIMKLLLTFMVQQNVDTLYEETYLALLANALLYMYKQPDSNWKKETLNLIYQTTKIVYMGTEKFENYLQKLFNNPGEAYLSKEEEYEEYVASSKPFIYLHYAAITNNIIKDFDAEIDRLIMYYFIREQYKHNWDINYYFRLSLHEQDKKVMQENMKKSFEKFISLKHFREATDQHLEEQLQQQFQNKQVQIELVQDKVFNKDMKLTLESIEGFYTHITNKKFDQNRYIHIIFQTLTQYKQKQQGIFNTPINYENIGEILHQLMQVNKSDLAKGQARSKHQLEREYLHYFYRIHMMTKPMSYEKLKEQCAAKNIDVNLVGYNHLSGLSSNCCFSQECPFYLRTDLGLDFKRHIQTWGRHVPAGFHKFVAEEHSKMDQLDQEQQVQKIIAESIKKWKQVKKLHEQHPNVLQEYLMNILSSFAPKDYKAELPQQQLVYKQVKLEFPKKQKLNRGMGRPRGRGGNQQNRGQNQIRGRRGGRGGRGGRGRGRR